MSEGNLYMNEKKRLPELTACNLKWIAAVTMLIDHIGVIFYPDIPGFRIVGRIAFPIFAFLIVEGFGHTHDLRKYMLRMLVFACVSEIPFDLAFYDSCFAPGHQNVMFTFFLALILLESMERIHSMGWKLLVFAGVLALASVLRTDYNYFGILLVCLYSNCASYRERWKRVSPTLLNVLAGSVQKWGMLAAVPLYFYGGKEGRKMKYFFYIFYPGHLLALYFIKYGKGVSF